MAVPKSTELPSTQPNIAQAASQEMHACAEAAGPQ
jgi:hypothetical protein